MTETTNLQKLNNALVLVSSAKTDLENAKFHLAEVEKYLKELGEPLGGKQQWEGLFLPEDESDDG